MRSLRRNKIKIFYALFKEVEEIIDEDGYATGEYTKTYEEPVELWINVSASRGTSATREFGEIENYDRTMVTTEKLPIDEKTILWVDETDTNKPYDYEIVKKAPSLNEVQYAIRKVKVKG